MSFRRGTDRASEDAEVGVSDRLVSSPCDTGEEELDACRPAEAAIDCVEPFEEEPSVGDPRFAAAPRFRRGLGRVGGCAAGAVDICERDRDRERDRERERADRDDRV